MKRMALLVVVLEFGCVLDLNGNTDGGGTTAAKGSCTQTFSTASPTFKVCTQYTGQAFLSTATLAKQQSDCTAATSGGSVFTWSASACPTANAFGKCSIDYRGTSNDISAEAVYYNDNLTAATTARTACTGTTAQGATLTWGSVDGTGGGTDGGGGGTRAYLCASAAAGVPADALFPPEACTAFSTTPSVSNSSWTYTTAADGAGGAGTSSWGGANLSVTGTWGQAGCMMSNVRVTACPVNGLLGVCKDTTHNTAFYYYSGWIFTAATAKAKCQSATYLGSGPGTQVSLWFATP